MPKHLVSSKDLKKEEYQEILRRFDYFMAKGISPDLARGKIVATLFLQPSTRTMNCFQSGMLRAGGGWIGVTGAEGLSLSKGESWRPDAFLDIFKPRIFEIEKEVDSDPRAVYAQPEPYTETALAVLTYLLGIKV